jgi:general secretion pathway protein G
MKAVYLYRRRPTKRECGFTLLELIIATAIFVVLSTMAVPFARLTITREKGRTLRKDLWEMRDAIDHFKDLTDRAEFRPKRTAKAIHLISKRW